MQIFFDSAKAQSSEELFGIKISIGTRIIRGAFYDVVVKATTDEFALEKSLINVLLVNAKGSVGRAQSKGVTANVARARGVVGRAKSTALVNFRQYQRRQIGYLATTATASYENFSVFAASPIVLNAGATLGPIRSFASVEQEKVVTGGGAIGAPSSVADVFVPFALRHRGQVPRVGSDGYVFVPPYDLYGKSAIPVVRSKAFVKTPYLLNAKGSVKAAGSKASLSLQTDALHLFRPMEGTSPFISILREDQAAPGFTGGATIDTLPTGGGYGEVKYSPDGKFVVLTGISSTTPRPLLYRRRNNSYTALGPLPGDNLTAANVAAWSHDSKYLFIGLGVAPWIAVYRREANETFTRLVNVGAVSAQAANAIATNPRNGLIAFTYSSSNSLALYRFENEAFTALTNSGFILPNENCQSPVWHPNRDNILLFMVYRRATGLGGKNFVRVEAVKVSPDLQRFSNYGITFPVIDDSATGLLQLFIDPTGKELFISTRRHRANGMGAPPLNDTAGLYALDIATGIVTVKAAAVMELGAYRTIEWLARSDDGRYIAHMGQTAAGRQFRIWYRSSATQYTVVSTTPLPAYHPTNPVVAKPAFSDQRIPFLEDATVEGKVTFPPFGVDGDFSTPKAEITGTVTFPVFDVSGQLIWHGATLEGALTFPPFDITGELGPPGAQLYGTLDLPSFTLTGELSIPGAEINGTLDLPAFSVVGELNSLAEINGILTFPAFDVRGHLWTGYEIEGTLTFPAFSLEGELSTGRYELNGILPLPQFSVEGRFSLFMKRKGLSIITPR